MVAYDTGMCYNNIYYEELVMGRSQSKRSNRKNTTKDFSNTNPVAKNMEKFNKPATHVDKKKESKIKYYPHIDDIIREHDSIVESLYDEHSYPRPDDEIR